MPELGDRIYERACLTGEFRLRSGATSSEYFDKYLFESDPPLIREIAEVLVGLLPRRCRPVETRLRRAFPQQQTGFAKNRQVSFQRPRSDF